MKSVFSNNIKINNIELLFLSLVILIFVLIDRTIIMNIGTAFPAYVILIISFLYCGLYLTKLGISFNYNSKVLLYLVFYLLFLIIYSLSTDLNDLNYALRILVYISIIFLFGNIRYSFRNLLTLVLPFNIFSVYLFVLWVISLETTKYSGIFGNPNTLGIVIYNILFLQIIIILSTKSKFIKNIYVLLIIFNIILLYVSTSRAVWLASLVSVIVYLGYDWLIRTKNNYKITYIITIIGILCFSYLYPRLYKMDIGWKINDFIVSITGKSFFSGRQYLWAEIISVIDKKLLFGFGLSTSSKELLGTNHEAHNMFLNILLKTGLVGLITYSILLYVIWMALYPGNNIVDNKNTFKIFPSYFAG